MEVEQEGHGDGSLRAIAVVLMCCGAVKALHLLGVIRVEGE